MAYSKGGYSLHMLKMPVPVHAQFGDNVTLLGRLVLSGTVENQDIQLPLPQ